MHRKSDVNGLHVPQTGLVTLALMRILMDMALVLAIPTEYLYDADTQSVGYTYTYFSSSAGPQCDILVDLQCDLKSSSFTVLLPDQECASRHGRCPFDWPRQSWWGCDCNLVSYLQRRWTDYSSGRGTSSSATNKDHLVPLI